MYRFHLDKAIATWRERLRRDRAFLADDLDELETHLRDHIDRLVAVGLTERDAFKAARQRLGSDVQLASEYRKVRFGRRKRARHVWKNTRWEAGMLGNYAKIALRNFRRQKGYAFINVVGLGIGIAGFLLIFLYLRHEYSFDTYHEKGDRIYRLVEYGGFGEKRWDGSVSGDPVPAMRDVYADVEDATKFKSCGSDRVQVEGEVYRDIGMRCTESSLFTIFSFGLLKGNPETVLDRPNTAVITRSLARRIFGDEEPVGKLLPIRFYEEERMFEITGLMADVPANTHINFDLLLSYESLRSTNRCLDCGQPMYALLEPRADPEAVAARTLKLIRDTQHKEDVEDLRLEPLADVHFSEIYAERQGDIRYVRLLSAIALVVLLIACANYMNLATARSILRTREVGMRKVVGAHRSQIVCQFLVETVLLTLLALPLALLLLFAALPAFNALAGTEIALGWRENLGLLGAVVGVTVLVGMLAGGYPALFLARFQPIEVLRGRLPSGFSNATLRRVLVVFQFAATIILLIGTAVIVSQLQYMQHRKLGFDAEQVVLVDVGDPLLQDQPDVLKQEFRKVIGVIDASAGYGYPGTNGFHGRRFIARPFADKERHVTIATPAIDADFLETMRISLLAGQNISKQPWDERSEEIGEALINEAGVRAMEWESPQAALGQEIYRAVIVGVVPDFNFESLHKPIEPLLMVQRGGSAFTVALRLEAGNIPNTLAGLKRAWEATETTAPFEFSFLTDELNQLYEQEQRTAKVFGAFAALAVLIACLGLLGLAAFTAARRTKEVGIRKVLGASVPNIVALLTKDFLLLVAVAFVIAVPVAYLAVQRWLEDFAYRIDVPWTVFAGTGLAVLAVALLTVSYQAIRAALADPVESVRYE
ncbi:MAG: FtsX-like permease family protein [Rhodothermales bacterium]